MKQVMTAQLIPAKIGLSGEVWIKTIGFQNNQYVDINNNVWQADEITFTGWAMWNSDPIKMY